MTKEEAVARIKDHIGIHRYHERNAVKIFEALDMAIKALEQSERKKGEWIKFNNSCTIQCDQCGQEMTSLCDIQLPNYCLNCGTNMREGEEE